MAESPEPLDRKSIQDTVDLCVKTATEALKVEGVNEASATVGGITITLRKNGNQDSKS